MAEPSHGEILRAIGAIEGKLQSLVDATKEDNSQRSSLGERIGKLENGMAQLRIIAVVAAVVTPILYSEVKDVYGRLSEPPHAERRLQPAGRSQ